MSILDQVVPATANPYLKGLFFGPSKSGKTTLVASAPKALLLDTEGGAMSVRGTDIDVLKIYDWETFEDVVKELTLGKRHGYESVALDSVTFLQEVAGRRFNLLNAITDPKQDARQAYGNIGAAIRHKIIQLINLPMNVLFTAQLRERDAVDLEAGQYPLTPDVTPAILKTLMAAPDVIGRTVIKQVGGLPTDVEYRVIFGPETRSQVGHRNLGLPSEVKGLTIPKLISLAKEAK